MNKVFKVIWNHATQTWTAVSELGHAKGKTKSKKIVKLTALAGAVLSVVGTAQAAVEVRSSSITIKSDNPAADHTTKGINNINIGTGANTYRNDGNNVVSHDAIAIGSSATGTGDKSVAIGKDASATKENGVAVGFGATNESVDSVAIGTRAKSSKDMDVAIGKEAQATGGESLAFGSQSKASGQATVAVGKESNASGSSAVAAGYQSAAAGNNAVAVGKNTTAGAENAIAVGLRATATGTRAIATGAGSSATGAQSLANGFTAKALDEDTIAQGNAATANKESDIAIGTSSVANGTSTKAAPPTRPNKSIPDDRGVGSAIAMGKNANAIGVSTIAVGQGAHASFDTATAIGYLASASKEDAIATGSKANASGHFSVATGSGSASSGYGSIATGLNSNASASAAIATGTKSNASGASSIAIGANANASVNNSVALGDGAVTTAAVNVASATINGVTYGNFAGSQPKSVVSVGKNGEERQVQNVAAGQITETSTDAVNGSQLYALAQKLGNGNGWNLKTKPNNSPKEAENGESTTTEENIAPDENVTLIAGKNIKLKQTGGDVLIATKDDVIFNTASIGGIKINTGGIQMNDQKITGLKAGEVNSTSKDAVNGSQLYNHPFHFQGFNGNEEGNGDQVSTDYIYRPGVEGNPKLQLVALNGLSLIHI